MEESYIYIWDEISVQTQNIYFNRLEICPFVFIAKFNKYICIYVVYIYLCVCALSLLVVLTLVIPQSVACQGPLFIGFSKQEYWSGLPCPPLEWVALPSSRGSSQPRDPTHVCYVSCIGRQILYRQCHLGITRLLI